jgi:hypothetical protein
MKDGKTEGEENKDKTEAGNGEAQRFLLKKEEINKIRIT